MGDGFARVQLAEYAIPDPFPDYGVLVLSCQGQDAGREELALVGDIDELAVDEDQGVVRGAVLEEREPFLEVSAQPAVVSNYDGADDSLPDLLPDPLVARAMVGRGSAAPEVLVVDLDQNFIPAELERKLALCALKLSASFILEYLSGCGLSAVGDDLASSVSNVDLRKLVVHLAVLFLTIRLIANTASSFSIAVGG